MPNHNQWNGWSSADNDALVEEMRRGGDWQDRIARRMGVGRQAVHVHARVLKGRGEIGEELWERSTGRWREMRGPHRLWKPEEVLRLRELAASGLSQREIAQRLGRTRGGVRSQMSLHGIRGGAGGDSPPWTDDEEAVLIRRVGDGWRYAAIAAELGTRTVSATGCRARKLGLRAIFYWTAAEKLRVRGMVANGASDEEIAAAVRHTVPAVKSMRHHLRLVRDGGRWWQQRLARGLHETVACGSRQTPCQEAERRADGRPHACDR
jgi:hypothetical protein